MRFSISLDLVIPEVCYPPVHGAQARFEGDFLCSPVSGRLGVEHVGDIDIESTA
jgi:hypothetical protein